MPEHTKERAQGSARNRGALGLLKRLRSGEVSPGEISVHERRVCVAYLKLEGYTQDEIAEIFQVHRQTIVRDQRALRKHMAKLVDELDVRAVAGGLIAYARHITARAMKGKDYALAWKVQRELISDLQSLGYLPKSAERHDVRIASFVELAQLALEQGQAPAEPAPEPVAALPASGGGDAKDRTR